MKLRNVIAHMFMWLAVNIGDKEFADWIIRIDQQKPFCDECAGPYDDKWLVEGYNRHWDTCPNGRK